MSPRLHTTASWLNASRALSLASPVPPAICAVRSAELSGPPSLAMPVRTNDGWTSRAQIKQQVRAWEKARVMLVDKLGDAMNDPKLLDEKAEELFNKFDAQGTGNIDATTLKEAMHVAGVTLTQSEIVDMMVSCDANKDGLIQLNEFQAVMRNEVAAHRRRSAACAVL